jgi:hypothetical protein
MLFRQGGVAATTLVAIACGVLGCGEAPEAASRPLGLRDREGLDHQVERTVRKSPESADQKRLEAYLANHRGRPLQWKVAGRPSGSRVTITQDVGICASPLSRNPADLPHIKGVQRTETARAVILTLLVVWPDDPNPCPRLGMPLYSAVRIPGGIKGRPLYDGSQSPPVKRWPGSRSE